MQVVLPDLIKMVPITLFIVMTSALCSLAAGIILTVVRIQKTPVLFQLSLAYISFIRSTPVIIQLFVIYYGAPVLFSSIGIDINTIGQLAFAVITLILHNSVYASEIIKPAYLSIDQGQFEAADSIGLSGYDKIKRIIAPQIIRIALPGAGNLLIELLMDSSIIFTIGVTDLMGQAKSIISSDYGVEKISVLVTVALIYWAISSSIEFLILHTERLNNKKYNLADHRPSPAALEK